MTIDMNKIESTVRKQFNAAKRNLIILAENREFWNKVISDVIPGYSTKQLEYGAYLKDNFAVLFVNMRDSTGRATTIGAEKTFLSMHAFIPALLAVVEHYEGYVIDIMGDGIMVFFGGKSSGIAKSIAIQQTGLCGVDMIKVIDEIVNKILIENEIRYKISIGVGCDYGDVIVTKIGTKNNFDTKAYGECINKASKYSKVAGRVKVSKKIKTEWPEGKKEVCN